MESISTLKFLLTTRLEFCVTSTEKLTNTFTTAPHEQFELAEAQRIWFCNSFASHSTYQLKVVFFSLACLTFQWSYLGGWTSAPLGGGGHILVLNIQNTAQMVLHKIYPPKCPLGQDKGFSSIHTTLLRGTHLRLGSSWTS